MSEHTKSNLTVSGDYLMGRCVGGCQLKEDEFMVAQVRGWGHLQYLGEEKAMAIQKANAERLALCWNSYESDQKLIKDLVKLLKMAKCPDCDGSGIVITKTRDRQYVSRDMAIDAGDRALEGALCQDEEFDYCQCQWCYEKKAIIAAAEKRSKE